MPLNRRQFILHAGVAGAGVICNISALSCNQPSQKIVTVTGPIDVSSLGLVLSHEHVIVDFIGADKVSKERYNEDEVFNTCLPFVQQLKQYECKSFIDCTPSWLGRDVTILKRLSQATGIQFVTNTGYYGAAGEKFLPGLVQTSTAKQIAALWINESKNGIDGTGIKPGFMKLGVDNLPFSDSILKILEAAAITHAETGLPIAVHTSNGGKPALEQMRLFKSWGLNPESWIWVHAQNEKDNAYHFEVGQSGGWISFDGINLNNTAEYINHLNAMKSKNLLYKVLLSQDAGWYNVGDAKGGKFRDYTSIFTSFIPALKKSGYSDEDIHLLFVKNPSVAFRVRDH